MAGTCSYLILSFELEKERLAILGQQEFNFLPENQKVSYLRQEGQFLISRPTPMFEVKLYWLHYFFVEVYSKHAERGSIFIHAFQSTQYLEPYLNQIELDLSF